MGEKLLSIGKGRNLDAHDRKEIIDTLGARLFFHGHPINRREAKEEIGLKWVRDAKPDEEKAMWELYEAYEEEMRLRDESSFVQEAIAKLGKPPELPEYEAGQSGEPNPTVENVDLDPRQMVWIESAARSDVRLEAWNVTLSRSADGLIDPSWVLTQDAWHQVR